MRNTPSDLPRCRLVFVRCPNQVVISHRAFHQKSSFYKENRQKTIMYTDEVYQLTICSASFAFAAISIRSSFNRLSYRRPHLSRISQKMPKAAQDQSKHVEICPRNSQRLLSMVAQKGHPADVRAPAGASTRPDFCQDSAASYLLPRV